MDDCRWLQRYTMTYYDYLYELDRIITVEYISMMQVFFPRFGAVGPRGSDLPPRSSAMPCVPSGDSKRMTETFWSVLLGHQRNDHLESHWMDVFWHPGQLSELWAFVSIVSCSSGNFAGPADHWILVGFSGYFHVGLGWSWSMFYGHGYQSIISSTTSGSI